MHISDVHDYSSTEQEQAKSFLSQGRKEAIAKEIERLREERDTYRNAIQNLTGQKICRWCQHIDICTCGQADWQPSSLAVWASNILLAYAEKLDVEGGE